jgi:hypothetical protein
MATIIKNSLVTVIWKAVLTVLQKDARQQAAHQA